MSTEPRASASVVLLRDDRSNGLEVFLLRRHAASSVWGGVHVFPGGKLDVADCAPHWSEVLDRPVASLHADLGEPDLPHAEAVGLFVAVVRETLEECRVSLVHPANDGFHAIAPEQRLQWQQRLNQGDNFFTLLQQSGVRLDTHGLAPWSRWITPLASSSGSPKRFDTRFFVAALPPGQEPVHDNVEAVDSLWLTPREALQRWWDKQIVLAPPQIMNLANLVPYADVSSVLQAARAKRPVRILPEAFVDAEGRRFLCYPGDPYHSVPERAQAGPTRLGYFDDRFEPEGGLKALLEPLPLHLT